MIRWLKGYLALCLLVVAGALPAQIVEYIHTDALGSPVAVTNAAGAVIEQSEYEPFGALINRGNHDGPGYTGHVMDGATGLTYMQQRYYDPVVGRFLSVDPVTGDGVKGNFNRYWYANNNPHKFTDPDGRDPCLGTRIGTCVNGQTQLAASPGPVGSVKAGDSAIDSGRGFASGGRRVSDPISDKRINDLDPRVRQPARNFLNEVEGHMGVRLRVVQGLRTKSEQDKMYAQGRTSPGPKVTNARGGESYHNYGLAIDVAGLNKDGSINWGVNYASLEDFARENGFEWGGNFKSIKDAPHYQMTFGSNIRDLQAGEGK